MSLLKKAVVEQSAAKVGIFGRQKSGKSTTSALIAIGLSKTYHKGAPVAFMDTENGSDYLIPIFEVEGVELLVIKSRAFKDMRGSLREAQQSGCCAFLVDSYTHPWQELTASFKEKSKRKRLEFHHMDELKSIWRGWTDQMLNSPLHCILSGRLGFEWGEEENDEGGKNLIKLGSKMKGEAEAGYEPSLLIEMEAIQESEARLKKTRTKKGSIVHYAYVIGDRWRDLNGRTFAFKDINDYKAGDFRKVFDAFAPHWAKLAIGTAQRAVDGERNSTDLFDTPGGQSIFAERARRKEVACDEIQGMLVTVWPGQDAASKGAKLKAITELFGVYSWKAAEEKPVDELELGVQIMHRFVQQMELSGRSSAEVDAALGLLAICRDAVKSEQPEMPRPEVGVVAGDNVLPL